MTFPTISESRLGRTTRRGRTCGRLVEFELEAQEREGPDAGPPDQQEGDASAEQEQEHLLDRRRHGTTHFRVCASSSGHSVHGIRCVTG